MQTRLKSLERVALVYAATKHARALSLQQAATALEETDAFIKGQRMRARRSSVEGKAALEAGESLAWQMYESERQFTEWNAEGLAALKQRRETLLREAVEEYRAGRLQLEQMESVLRELRASRNLERAHQSQRESDDRFLSRRRWAAKVGVDRPNEHRKDAANGDEIRSIAAGRRMNVD